MAHAVEAASKYSYDSVADQWHRETVWVRIDDEPFAMVMMLRADVGDNLRPCVAWIPDTVHVDPDRANREPATGWSRYSLLCQNNSVLSCSRKRWCRRSTLITRCRRCFLRAMLTSSIFVKATTS